MKSTTNSELGSYHWFHTHLARLKHIGEYLRDFAPELRTTEQGATIYDSCEELIAGFDSINQNVVNEEVTPSKDMLTDCWRRAVGSYMFHNERFGDNQTLTLKWADIDLEQYLTEKGLSEDDVADEELSGKQVFEDYYNETYGKN